MTTASRIAELGRKAKTLASQLSTGKINEEIFQDMKQELSSSDLKERIMEECAETETWETTCEVLLSTLSDCVELLGQLVQEALKFKNESKDLKKKVEDLTKDVEELKKVKKKAELTSNRLMVGQIAFEVEKAIVKHVLEEVIGPPWKSFIKSISNMQQALNRERNFSDILSDDLKCKEAGQRWKDLQKELGWEERHFRCIDFFKMGRYDDAHPTLDTNILKRAIKEHENFQFKSECKELLNMLDKMVIIQHRHNNHY